MAIQREDPALGGKLIDVMREAQSGSLPPEDRALAERTLAAPGASSLMAAMILTVAWSKRQYPEDKLLTLIERRSYQADGLDLRVLLRNYVAILGLDAGSWPTMGQMHDWRRLKAVPGAQRKYFERQTHSAPAPDRVRVGCLLAESPRLNPSDLAWAETITRRQAHLRTGSEAQFWEYLSRLLVARSRHSGRR